MKDVLVMLLLKINSISPVTTLLPVGNYFECQLIKAIDSSVVKPWQIVDSFVGGIEADSYKIQARMVCPTGFSSPLFSATLKVKKSIVVANITSVDMHRAANCCDGIFKVNASSSGPLQYALVTSLNAHDIASR